jgi:hypothetical protein
MTTVVSLHYSSRYQPQVHNPATSVLSALLKTLSTFMGFMPAGANRLGNRRARRRRPHASCSSFVSSEEEQRLEAGFAANWLQRECVRRTVR